LQANLFLAYAAIQDIFSGHLKVNIGGGAPACHSIWTPNYLTSSVLLHQSVRNSLCGFRPLLDLIFFQPRNPNSETAKYPPWQSNGWYGDFFRFFSSGRTADIPPLMGPRPKKFKAKMLLVTWDAIPPVVTSQIGSKKHATVPAAC
jgi:hypothetical protein